jgi:hypothetical protein
MTHEAHESGADLRLVAPRSPVASLWSSISDVPLLRWPEQEAEVDRLDGLGLPRLVLVHPRAIPPTHASCLQDWVRLPADDREIEFRLSTLRSRAADPRRRPTIDEYGLLSYHGQVVPLSRIDARVVEALLERLGEVVEDATLMRRAWPGGSNPDGSNPDGLRVHVSRIRQRLAPLGLSIVRVRGAGYVLRCPSS